MILYIHAHKLTYTYIHTHTYIHTCIHTYIHIYLYILRSRASYKI